MNGWPNADSLKDVLTKWHTAFMGLRDTWNAIPETDRIGLQGPPAKMEPT